MSTRRVLCPRCQREIQWTEEFPYRPFCSARCRLIDLGAWLTQQHTIPGGEDGEAQPGGDDDADSPPQRGGH